MTLSFLIGAATSLLPILSPADSTRGASSATSKTTTPAKPAPAAPVARGRLTAIPLAGDSLVVDKSDRTLTLYSRGAPVRIYFVALGKNPTGDKQHEGDNRTPEGVFRIANRNPQSKFHLALRISYPDIRHLERARSLGMAPGGDIMIHGLALEFASAGNAHRLQDWTNGCIALTNEEIEELWSAVADGTPIEIRP
jgi:murein L,D-transpeptidase YafK